MPDGRVLGRAEQQADLREAAKAVLGSELKSADEARFCTHSLRISCATWLYQAGYSIDYIKRHGRWISNL